MLNNAKPHLFIGYNLILSDKRALKLDAIRSEFMVIFYRKGTYLKLLSNTGE